MDTAKGLGGVCSVFGCWCVWRPEANLRCHSSEAIHLFSSVSSWDLRLAGQAGQLASARESPASASQCWVTSAGYHALLLWLLPLLLLFLPFLSSSSSSFYYHYHYWDRVSLRSPDWPRAHSVGQDGLSLTQIHLLLSPYILMWVLGIQFRSLCLCLKHFATGTISSPRSIYHLFLYFSL